jgi:hypothetical protein
VFGLPFFRHFDVDFSYAANGPSSLAFAAAGGRERG